MARTRQRVGLRAALLALALSSAPAYADGVAPKEASKEQAELAQKSFLAGDEHYDAKRYEEALKLYRESFEVVASPNSRLMIARSLRELGRLDEAIPEFEAAVEVARAAAAAEDKYAQTQKAAEEELRQLNARVGRLQIKLVGASTDAKVTIAGKSYDAAALERPVVLAPGNVSVAAVGTDGREVRMEVAVAAGATASIELDLATQSARPIEPTGSGGGPAPPADRPSVVDPNLRMWAYVAGGVGVVGLAAFTVFGVMNNSKFSSLESDCPDGRCPPDRQSDIDAGKRYQAFANIGLAVGVLGIGSGVALYFVSSSTPEKSARAQKRVLPPPALRIGPGSVTFGGRF